MAKTPNKYHYVPLIDRYTPTWFHKFYNKLRGRESEDSFPRRYLLNSMRDQSLIAQNSGFKVEWINSYKGRPEYLRLFFLAYIVGIIHEIVVNALNINQAKILLISKFKKEL